jgi:hypothetical protein
MAAGRHRPWDAVRRRQVAEPQSGRLPADFVAKVLFRCSSKFFWVADAIFEQICEVPHSPVTNSLATSETSLAPYLSATAVIFVSDEISGEQFWTFATISTPSRHLQGGRQSKAPQALSRKLLDRDDPNPSLDRRSCCVVKQLLSGLVACHPWSFLGRMGGPPAVACFFSGFMSEPSCFQFSRRSDNLRDHMSSSERGL